MFHLFTSFPRVVASKSGSVFYLSSRVNSEGIKLAKRHITRSFCNNHSSSDSGESLAQKPAKLETVLLKSRSLIRLQGPDTLPLLQGLITNDVSHFENRPTIYALFLNTQGRVLWDTIVYSVKEDADSDSKIFVECDSSIKNNLINHLKIFKLRKKVDIIDVEGEKESAIDLWVVFDSAQADLTNPVVKDENATTVVQQLTKRPDVPINIDASLKSFNDPRLNELGWRVFVPRSKSNLFPPKDLIVSEEDSYKRLRYKLGVAEGVTELPTGNCFPLESNGDYLHGISFHKGCYIGQELTARTHHTGVIRKRIMPFRLLDGNLDGVDLSTLQLDTPAGKRSLGKIRGALGSVGIGLIRIDEALSSPELKIQNCSVKLEKPFWWPVEASKEIQTR